MSLLTLIKDACREIGSIGIPTSVSSSTDPQVIQLMQIATAEGRALSRRYQWQALQNESTFVTVAVEAQGAITTLAGAGFRYILNDIMWNRDLRRPVYGPLTPQDWAQLKAQNITGPFNQFRIRGSSVKFIPAPAAGQTIAFEWISKYWATGAGGDAAAWVLDADTSYLDEEIMTQGVIWRWKKAKGLEYAQDFDDYETLVVDAMARDGGKRRLNMNGVDVGYPAGVLVAIGSWPV